MRRASRPGAGQEMQECKFQESANFGVLEITEGEVELREQNALEIRAVLIEPGWGNTRDNNYYPAEVLARDAHIFENTKMYVTNHVDEEVNVRNEVGQIMKCPDGFTETGGIIARVGIFDPIFAENIRNRAELGVLDGLHDSIAASGSREGDYEQDGREGYKVTELSSARSVEFVPQAGAGGRVIELIESAADTGGKVVDEKEKQAAEEKAAEEKAAAEKKAADEKEAAKKKKEDEEKKKKKKDEDKKPSFLKKEGAEEEAVFLNEAEVKEAIEATNLPKEAKAKLITGQYKDTDEVDARVKEEAAYIKAIKGSGQPFSEGSANEPAASSQEEFDADVRESFERHGIILRGKE